MRKQLAVFSWWLDSAAQLTMLLGLTFTVALGWWLAALSLMFFLGAWQLSSGIVWGIVQRDHWRLIYVGVALALISTVRFGFPALEKILPDVLFQIILGVVALICYTAAWVFLWHTHIQKPAIHEDDTAGFVPNHL